MKVNILIAGFQKCGTSALHSFLSGHPNIIGSYPKELDFFNYNNNFEKGSKYYHTFFKNKTFSSLRGFNYLESSPSYLTGMNVLTTANRIKKYNGRIKIIGLVRNPNDRAFSAWNMYRKRFLENNGDWWFNWVEHRTGKKPIAIRRSKEEYKDFSLFIEKELEALQKGNIIECPILNNGNYYRSIQIYKDIFANDFCIFKNEDLNESTSITLEKISFFLNLANYSWDKFDGIKVFKGNYTDNIPEKAKSLLTEYYLISNEKLKKLTGISY
ncbi:MAG: hypothetical protein COA67_00595 [Lutibacter sp.]|nr:MAG: hypothetical protein COA67_00595 [Lutibacter sp.]